MPALRLRAVHLAFVLKCHQKLSNETKTRIYAKNLDDYLKDQHATCERYNVDWVYADIKLKIGIADNVFTDVIPINGMRHQVENGTTGWYIWSGENFSINSDFFKPFCVKHLIELNQKLSNILVFLPVTGFSLTIKDLKISGRTRSY